jgi:hypothetical protein
VKLLPWYDFHEAKHKTEKVLYEPWLIFVLGWRDKRCPATRYIYGDKKNKMSTHFSWHDAFDCFVQCVSMDVIACFGENRRMRSVTGNIVRSLDRKCISITIRPTDDCYVLLDKLIGDIKLEVPTIRGICCSSNTEITRVDGLTMYQEV